MLYGNVVSVNKAYTVRQYFAVVAELRTNTGHAPHGQPSRHTYFTSVMSRRHATACCVALGQEGRAAASALANTKQPFKHGQHE